MVITNEQPIIVKKVKKPKRIRLIPKAVKEAYLNKGGNPLEKAAKVSKLSPANIKLAKMMAEFKPIKDIMITGLKSRGLEVPNNLAMLCEKFYNEVVLNSYQTPMHKYSASMKPVDVYNERPDNFDNLKDSLFSGITTFIQNTKRKGDQGLGLSKTEEAVYNASKVVEANAEKAAKRKASEKIGEKILFDPKVRWALIGVAGLVVFLIVRAIR